MRLQLQQARSTNWSFDDRREKLLENVELSHADFAQAFGPTASKLDSRETAAIDEENIQLGKLSTPERAGKISVQRIKRIGFGSMMMECSNLFVWRPES